MAAGFLNALAAIPQGFMQGQQYTIDQNYQQALRDLAIQQQRQQQVQNLQRQQALGLLYRAYGQGQQQQQNPNPFGQPMDLQAAQQFTPPPQIPQQPPQPLVPPSAALNRPPTPAMLPTIADRESSGGLNRYNPTPTSSGNAEGLYGITTGTWRDFAPKAGVSLASAPTPNAADDKTQGQVAQQIPLKRWAPKTVAAVAQLSPEHQAAASQTAVTAAASMPPQLAGQLDPRQLKDMIERAAEPGTPDEVKGAALVQLQQLMRPDAREQLQLYEFAEKRAEHRQDMDQRERDFQQRERDISDRASESRDLRRALASQGKGSDWQVFQTPEGGLIRGNRATGAVGRMDLPAGTTKIGSPNQAKPSDRETDFWASVLHGGGSLPPGLGRNGAFVQAVAKRMADLYGGDPGSYIANVSTVKADQHSLSALTKMTDMAVSFEETALKNLEIATKNLHGTAPTELGPLLNRWIETGQTTVGDPNVPATVTAVITFANEYAKVMSGATGAQGATDTSRREAAELFNPYFSSGQWDRVAAIARADMANRKQSLFEQKDAIAGRIRGASQGGAAEQSPAGVGQPTLEWDAATGTLKPISNAERKTP